MQAIGETVFEIPYLLFAIGVGIYLVIKSGSNPALHQYKTFGYMAIVLGLGDSTHLIPRMYALWNGGLALYPQALGIGKLITSITMTIFYVLLYAVWKERYHVQGEKTLNYWIWGLALVRIALCLFPQNDWLALHGSLAWGIYRNIPFAILGGIMIWIYYQKATQTQDHSFRWMWLAILLSFGFYIPVVLWSGQYPLVGMLMIPKTIAYIWILCMGLFAYRKQVQSVE